MTYMILIIILFLFIDQLIKFLVASNMYVGQSITIISNFFKITYVTNDGAAFNLFSGNILFLVIIAILVIFYIIKNIKTLEKKEKYIYSILIAGILGNLIDRIFRGFVIDYIDFRIFGYDMAIFNFADICIVCSCILLVLMEVIKWRKSLLKKEMKD